MITSDESKVKIFKTKIESIKSSNFDWPNEKTIVFRIVEYNGSIGN